MYINILKACVASVFFTEVIVETQAPHSRTVTKSKNNHFSLVCVEDEDDLPKLSSTDVIIKELENYSSIRASVNEFSCPLNFYKTNENKIPNMAKIAKMVFCITASSVPSKCLFSTAGDLISQKRSRLHPECAQDLLLLNKNKFE